MTFIIGINLKWKTDPDLRYKYALNTFNIHLLAIKSKATAWIFLSLFLGLVLAFSLQAILQHILQKRKKLMNQTLWELTYPLSLSKIWIKCSLKGTQWSLRWEELTASWLPQVPCWKVTKVYSSRLHNLRSATTMMLNSFYLGDALDRQTQ